MMSIRKRYETDTWFRMMVDQMYTYVEGGKTTPTEIREAAMLAQIMYEERHPRPIHVAYDDALRAKW